MSRRESGLEVTTAGVLRIAKATAPPRIQEADERGRYSILSELEQHRDLLQSILKPEIPADGITLTVEQTRNVHRLLKEMRRLLTQLRKQNSEPDQD
ncbi:MAG: hypothetical protein KDA60_15605 [Planctomycetales bacterium]|nr:hypothetical protein [Planctomycetales bacterium]